jgi:site-specific recombinase XerD
LNYFTYPTSGYGQNTNNKILYIKTATKHYSYLPETTKGLVMSEPRLQQQFRNMCATRHYSLQTEKTYWHWIKRFILYNGTRHPNTLEEVDVSNFLTYLAVERSISPATQSIALNAIVCLYKYVIKRELGKIPNFQYAKSNPLIPEVLTREEVGNLLHCMSGEYRLMASLMYSSGLRISECISLRVKDIKLSSLNVIVYAGKGNKNRQTIFSDCLTEALETRIAQRRKLHEYDLSTGKGSVYLPFAYERKNPSAAFDFQWQYLFTSNHYSRNPRDGREHRHHIQDLLGHSDPKTTEIYTHIMDTSGRSIISPLKSLYH